MAKTTSDVVTEAFRHLALIDKTENPSAEESVRGTEHLTAIYDMLDDSDEFALPFTLSSISEWAYLPLSIALAGSLAIGESVPEMAGEYRRGRAMIRKHLSKLAQVDGRPIDAVYY